MNRLEEIRERCSRATPGPWASFSHSWSDTSIFANDDLRVAMVNFQGEEDDVDIASNHDNDADFIAHSRADIPYLLDEIDRLREVLRAI